MSGWVLARIALFGNEDAMPLGNNRRFGRAYRTRMALKEGHVETA